MDFLTYVKEHHQEIITPLKHLLEIESVLEQYDPKSSAPFGEKIKEALDFMLKLAHKDGFITKNIRHYAAHIEHGSGDTLIGILCHLDVVPSGDGWKHPAFSPIIKDQKLYARGTMDDKGPTLAAYFALKFLKDLNIPLHKRVRIILGTDEETAWRGIQEYFKTEEMPDLGFAPDASFPLIYGEKGIWTFDIEGEYEKDALLTFKSGKRYNVVPDYAECTLTIDLKASFLTYLKHNNFKGEIKENTYIVHGQNAHAMQPSLGINAAFILASFLKDHLNNKYINFIVKHLAFDAYGEKMNIDHNDEEMKEFTINPGIFIYHQDDVKIGINCRYPKGFNVKDARTKVETLLKPFNLSYHEKSVLPIHYVDPKDPLIKQLMSAYRKVTNDTETQPFTIGGGTYARALKKAVAFGPQMPGRKDVVHQVDEHIFIDDLIEATAIYMEAIYSLTR